MSMSVRPSNYFCNACEIYMVTDTQDNILCSCCGREAKDIWSPKKTELKSDAAKTFIEYCRFDVDKELERHYASILPLKPGLVESKINMDDEDICISCGGQLYLFLGIQYCCRCQNVCIDPSNTSILTDDEIDTLLDDNKITNSKSKLTCPDCNSMFIKEGIKLFTSIEKHKCGDCGHEWI